MTNLTITRIWVRDDLDYPGMTVFQSTYYCDQDNLFFDTGIGLHNLFIDTVTPNGVTSFANEASAKAYSDAQWGAPIYAQVQALTSNAYSSYSFVENISGIVANSIDTLTASISALSSALTTAQSDITSLQSSRTTDEADISSLKTSRTTDEANIAALQAGKAVSGISLSIVTSTAGGGTQLSATKSADLHATVSTSTTSTIGGAATSIVVLEVAPTNSSTPGDWVEKDRFEIDENITLAIALQSVQTVKGSVESYVPGGYYVRLRGIGTGTHAEAFIEGSKAIYP